MNVTQEQVDRKCKEMIDRILSDAAIIKDTWCSKECVITQEVYDEHAEYPSVIGYEQIVHSIHIAPIITADGIVNGISGTFDYKWNNIYRWCTIKPYQGVNINNKKQLYECMQEMKKDMKFLDFAETEILKIKKRKMEEEKRKSIIERLKDCELDEFFGNATVENTKYQTTEAAHKSTISRQLSIESPASNRLMESVTGENAETVQELPASTGEVPSLPPSKNSGNCLPASMDSEGAPGDVRNILAPVGTDYSTGVSITEDQSDCILPIENGIYLELVKIQAGSFQMGSSGENEEYRDDETQHCVTITKDYWLGKYQVTQEQYEAIMGCNPSYFTEEECLPVEYVPWEKAMEFCLRLNSLSHIKLPSGYQFSLPTEAEWEYAARGGNCSRGYIYSGSNDCEEVAWYIENSGLKHLDDDEWNLAEGLCNNNKTHPVGQKKPNELGLYDMSGNVCEWCLDECCDYQEFGKDEIETDTYKNNFIDPLCTSGLSHILRGGSFSSDKAMCRSARRKGASDSSSRFGFRIAIVPVR